MSNETFRYKKTAFLFCALFLVIGYIGIRHVTHTDGGRNLGPVMWIDTEGEQEYVVDARLGYCDQRGEPQNVRGISDRRVITLYIQNLDGWLLKKAVVEPSLLPDNLTLTDIEAYRKSKAQKKSEKNAEEPQKQDPIQERLSQWYAKERSQLRLSIAGRVFETIEPFDPSARSNFGTGNYAKETFDRIVFPLYAPSQEMDLKKWQDIVRILGSECSASLTVCRILPNGRTLSMFTKVNTGESGSVGRSLPLVPAIRQSAAIVIALFTLAVLICVSLCTDALRDARNSSLPAGINTPWSLSRVVFAWWLTIILLCFIFLWATIGEHRQILSQSAMLLLGIQGTTMVISANFGRNPKASVTSKAQVGSRGILDLISENGEPEVSRLQMLVWNLILGVVFMWQSFFQWQMPDFDATLMTLIGISSTTYVGFKLSAQPEKEKKASQPG